MVIPPIIKKYKILFSVILILLILGFTALKTSFPKKLLNLINKDLIEKNKSIIEENESMIKQIQEDSIQFRIDLNKKAIEVEAFRFKYNNSLKTIRNYENALNNYRTGDYLYNFLTFANNVTSKDTLSIKRFNTNN